MMKKLIAITILGLLMLSVLPMAFAEEDYDINEKKVRKSYYEIEYTVSNDSLEVDETEIDEVIKRADEQTRKEKLRERERLKALEQRKEVSKEQLKESRTALNSAAQRSIEAKEKAREAKRNFDEVKKEIKKCDSIRESEDCKELGKKIKSHSIEFLLSSRSQLIEEINKVVSKTIGSNDLTEEESLDIIMRMEYFGDQLEEIRIDIESLNENSTKEEIRTIADQMKLIWKELRPELEQSSGKIVNSRIGGIVVESEQLKEKLIRVLDTAREQGIDYSEMERLVEKFDAKLLLANSEYEKALKLYENKNTIREANEAMTNSKEALREAHEILKDIFAELKDKGLYRELNNEDNLDEDSESEVEVETEEEEESEDVDEDLDVEKELNEEETEVDNNEEELEE